MTAEDRERWDARYRASVAHAPGPPAALVRAAPWLPQFGLGLDLACGTGGGALWLAGRGLSVDAVDVSPVALAVLAGRAASSGLADRVRVVEADLDDGVPTVGRDHYDVLLCLSFRFPILGRVAAELLRPGGLVVASVLSSVGREEGGAGPGPDARFVAEPGELLDQLATFEVLHHEERDGRAAIVARRPAVPR
jgi:SAM-dependent methyltransferase